MKNTDAVLVTGRISKEETKLLDIFADNHGISRSQAVADAVKYYISCNECIECGTLNPASGLHCSKCGCSLISDTAINLLLETLGEIELNNFMRDPELQDDEVVRDFKTLQKAGYKPLIIPTILRKNNHSTVYLIECGFTTKEGFRIRTTESFLESGVFGSIVPGSVLASALKDKEVAEGLQNLDKISPEEIAALKEKIKQVGFEKENTEWIDVAEMLKKMERK